MAAHPQLWTSKQHRARHRARTHRCLRLAAVWCLHMFTAIMSRYVILPAGRSWQSEKPCVKFYQLVCTSRVIIPQCITVVTWIDFLCFFFFLRMLTAPNTTTHELTLSTEVLVTATLSPLFFHCAENVLFLLNVLILCDSDMTIFHQTIGYFKS